MFQKGNILLAIGLAVLAVTLLPGQAFASTGNAMRPCSSPSWDEVHYPCVTEFQGLPGVFFHTDVSAENKIAISIQLEGQANSKLAEKLGVSLYGFRSVYDSIENAEACLAERLLERGEAVSKSAIYGCQANQ